MISQRTRVSKELEALSLILLPSAKCLSPFRKVGQFTRFLRKKPDGKPFCLEMCVSYSRLRAIFHVCRPDCFTSYENQNPNPTSSSNLLGNERHRVAESLKLPDRTL